MKRMKKLVALALATIMILAMGMTAMAAPEDGEKTTYEVSIAEVPEGHTYKIYQIFTGKLDSTGKILSDIAYGKNYAGNSEYESAYKEAQSITDANAFAASITLKEEPVATLTGKKTSDTLPESGYYMVVDESAGTETGADQISKYIVSVGGDIVITPKVSKVPGFVKTIDDKKATVDYAAKEDIPFTLTAIMPEDVATYDSYQLTFTDTLSDNLAFNSGTLEVAYKINDTANEVKYDSKDYDFNIDGQNITITMSDIGDAARVPNAKIIVKYDATLNADVGSGEVASNEAKLEFGNNGDNQGVGTTTTEVVKVYTFELNFNKVKEDGTALNGAEFTLYDSKDEVVKTVTGSGDGDVKNNFVFTGLKAGTYRLSETKVPNGYNKMEDMTITIGADISGETVTVNALTGAEGWDNTGFVYSTDITNYAGVTLPSTGGIGTTIFYVVGGIMVLGACILLITKKRMSARD